MPIQWRKDIKPIGEQKISRNENSPCDSREKIAVVVDRLAENIRRWRKAYDNSDNERDHWQRM